MTNLSYTKSASWVENLGIFQNSWSQQPCWSWENMVCRWVQSPEISRPHKQRKRTPEAKSKAGFPLGEFVRANREKKQLDWLATNTYVITSQSQSLFACSREQIRQVENWLKYTRWKVDTQSVFPEGGQNGKCCFLSMSPDDWKPGYVVSLRPISTQENKHGIGTNRNKIEPAHSWAFDTNFLFQFESVIHRYSVKVYLFSWVETGLKAMYNVSRKWANPERMFPQQKLTIENQNMLLNLLGNTPKRQRRLQWWENGQTLFPSPYWWITSSISRILRPCHMVQFFMQLAT